VEEALEVGFEDPPNEVNRSSKAAEEEAAGFVADVDDAPVVDGKIDPDPTLLGVRVVGDRAVDMSPPEPRGGEVGLVLGERIPEDILLKPLLLGAIGCIPIPIPIPPLGILV